VTGGAAKWRREPARGMSPSPALPAYTMQSAPRPTPGEMGTAVLYEEFLELVKTRRTIRAIKPDPISDELVVKILEAARWAPTGFNMQPLELVAAGTAR